MISVLQCVAVRCSALQCVAGRCRALQGVAGRCRALQGVAMYCRVYMTHSEAPTMRCVSLSFSLALNLMQCVAYVAVRCVCT